MRVQNPQRIEHRSTKVLVAGSSGTGKTTFALEYLRGCWHDFVFVYDHESEIGSRLGFPVYESFSRFAADIESEVSSPKGRRLFVYDPSEEFPGENETGFDAFCEFVFQASPKFGDRESLVFVDELQKVTGPWNAPVPLKTILQTGRRRAIDFFATTQSPSEIHNTIRNQCTELVCFSLLDVNSLKFAKECGFSVEEVSALRPGTYIAWNRYAHGFSTGQIFVDKR